MAEKIVLDAEIKTGSAEGSVKSLKAQLKEAQAEVAKMADQFGETSKQAADAAKKAADLKDRIGDAKALTDAFSPDRKFAALGAAMQGVAGGFAAVQGAMGLMGSESEDLQKQLLKVQSAMALVQGLNALTEAKDSFKNLKSVAVDTFNGIKSAIGASGIGLIVVGLGAIAANWDKIKNAISGVDEQQEKLNKNTRDNLETQKAKLKAVTSQDNILKLQGKSEKDILKLKIAQYDETIAATEAVIKQNEITTKGQVEAAKRNQDILKGLLKFIAYPIEIVYKSVSKIINGLIEGLNYLPGVNIKFRMNGNLIEEGEDWLAKQLFDPESVQAEADKVKKENQDALDELKNQRAGTQLEINQIDKNASDERKKNAEEEAKAIAEANKKANEEAKKLADENFLAKIKDERKRAESKLALDFANQSKDISQTKAGASEKANLLKQLQEKYQLDLAALKDKFAEEDKKKADEKLKSDLAKESETHKMLLDARLNAMKNEAVKRQEIEANRYQNEIDKQLELFNTKQIDQDEYNKRREAIELEHQTNLKNIEKQNSEDRIRTAQAEYDAKLSIYNEMSNALGALSNAIGESTKIGKAMAMAELAINTGVAISGIVRQATKNPTNLTPFQLVADIAIRTAAVISNIKKAANLIKGANVPGGGEGGGVNIGMPSAAPIGPQMSQTALNQQMINQMGNAASRAFVLESDVSGNQERIRRLNRAARIN